MCQATLARADALLIEWIHFCYLIFVLFSFDFLDKDQSIAKEKPNFRKISKKNEQNWIEINKLSWHNFIAVLELIINNFEVVSFWNLFWGNYIYKVNINPWWFLIKRYLFMVILQFLRTNCFLCYGLVLFIKFYIWVFTLISTFLSPPALQKQPVRSKRFNLLTKSILYRISLLKSFPLSQFKNQ